MADRQYVQHISGQGEKWELSGRLYNEEQNFYDWQVAAKPPKANDELAYHYLPKSEYRLCEPPGPEWEPIDAAYITVQVIGCDGVPVFGQFRMWCSSIEKKVSE